MTKRTLVATVGMLALVTACGGTHDTTVDLAAIGKVRDAYAAAFNAGNAGALGALFAADGNDMGNAQPTAIGPQAVEAATTALLAQIASQNVVITPEKTDVSGDFAYERGTFKTTLTPKSGGPPIVEDGRYLVVLQRQADGSWKLVDNMGNLATAPTPPAAMAAAPAKAPAKPAVKKAPTKK